MPVFLIYESYIQIISYRLVSVVLVTFKDFLGKFLNF